MNTFNAQQARELAGPSVEDYVDEALELIKKSATDKKRMVALHADFWSRGGYSNTLEWRVACKALEDRGFKVTFFYEELQFPNMYTKVQW